MDTQSNKRTSTNPNHVMYVIKEMLDRAKSPRTGECCIYKVPFDIRRLNKVAYTPKVVSIGPFHYRNPRLQNMQSYKLKYCNEFLGRVSTTISLEKLVHHIEDTESSVRSCYSDMLDLPMEELVKVILVDSAFIFELFWREFDDEQSPDEDTLFLKPWLRTSITLDLLLLENQLPFSVLETLFKLAFAPSISDKVNLVPSFLELTFSYFKDYNHSEIDADNNVNIKHFTDLIRTFYVYPSLAFKRDTESDESNGKDKTICLEIGLPFWKGKTKYDESTGRGGTEYDESTGKGRTFDLETALQLWKGRAKSDESTRKDRAKSVHLVQSATELLEAGVKLEVNSTSCLLDLKFSGKVLEIPQLEVHDFTEMLFCNLIALEQCHYPDKSSFTDYVAIMDFLINTSRDVDVLVRKEILVNWLGDRDSVAKLFNRLWKNVIHGNFSVHYRHLCRDLNAFCGDWWHRLIATLWHDYGNTPWQAAVSIAGIVLLFLSILQSVCSVIQVVQQAKQ